jgi:hypothetical protein
VTRLERELDNWRTAIAYAIETADLDALADLFGSIPVLPLYGTRTGSAFALAALDALHAIGEPDHTATAALLALAAYDQYLRAQYEFATQTGLRASAIAELHESSRRAFPWGFVYAAAYFGGDFETALRAAREIEQLGRQTGDAYTATEGLGLELQSLMTLNRTDEAAAIIPELEARAKAIDSPLSAMVSSFMLGSTHALLGDSERASALLQESALLATALENPFFALAALGMMAASTPDVPVAAAQFRSALDVHRSLPHHEVARDQLTQVASILVRAGRLRSAATLYGVSSQVNDNPFVELEPALHDLTATLGKEQLDDLLRKGSRLTVDEALDLAIAELDAVAADEPD